MSEERERRVGLNEALFRQVNEQIRALDQSSGREDASMAVICECGSAACIERIRLPVSQYERVRGDSRHYVVASGHEFPDVEELVERRDGYDIVRKREGIAAEVADETDPRS